MTSWAQIEQGSFVGIVLDPQKAPVAGAAVTFRSLTTNVQREELTKSGGDYNSPPLQPGRYAVTVKHAGFREHTIEVTLGVGQRLQLDFALELGAVTDQVGGFHGELRVPMADTVDRCQSRRTIHSKDVTNLAR
jgi:hypothetical protein